MEYIPLAMITVVLSFVLSFVLYNIILYILVLSGIYCPPIDADYRTTMLWLENTIKKNGKIAEKNDLFTLIVPKKNSENFFRIEIYEEDIKGYSGVGVCESEPYGINVFKYYSKYDRKVVKQLAEYFLEKIDE